MSPLDDTHGQGDLDQNEPGSYLPILATMLEAVWPSPGASPTERLSTKSSDDLEWPTLLEELAQRCETEEGKRIASHLPLLRPRQQVERRLREVEEGVGLVVQGDHPSTWGVEVLAPALEYAGLGGVLEGKQLLAISRAARASDDAARVLNARRLEAPLLAEVARDLKPVGWLSDRVDRMLDPEGNLADDASPDLAEMRAQVRRAHERLRQKIDSYLKKPEYQEILQDRFFTIREGRFVLPVRVSERKSLPGIVHGYSGSGQSVFIEPTELVDLNNQLRLAEIEVEAEERRILHQLSQEVAEIADALGSNVDRLFYLDLTWAAAHLAWAMKAARPTLSEGHEVDLRQARHPLLALRQSRSEDGFEVVPSDIRFGQHGRSEPAGTPMVGAADRLSAAATGLQHGPATWSRSPGGEGRVLVISGPNTGGKTVTLKTIGLCALMVRAGLLLPAEEQSEIPLFDRVFTDVGDEQSLAENLSSFSAHLTHIQRVLPQVDDRSLLLLDELFSGTDPAQGAAMAIAILEDLACRGALVVATTHFDTLKRYALRADRFLCASMGFDLKTLSPTFELRPGIPGASYAIGIARRLGFPGTILDRAQELMEGSDQDNLEEILADLESYRLGLEEQKEAALTAQRQADQERIAHQREREALKKAALEAVDQNLTRVFEEIRQAEALVRRRRKELSIVLVDRPPHPGRLEEIGRELARIKEELEERKQERKLAEIAQTRRPLRPEEVQADLPVWVGPFGRSGKVSQVDQARGLVLVQLGSMKVTVRVAELFEPDEADRAADRAAERARPATVAPEAPRRTDEPPALVQRDPAGWLGPQTAGNTVDLRGLRVEEALQRLDRLLDAAYKRREPGVYIIHGHGTGALRSAVRSLLPDSPYVQSFRAGERIEGGDGVTVAWLKGD
ncbi:MAG: Smr/MutS family protein [Bradymonadales bacterium]|nr:Smr/MutS family protein [Bradymonadales bacterium]